MASLIIPETSKLASRDTYVCVEDLKFVKFFAARAWRGVPLRTPRTPHPGQAEGDTVITEG